MISKERERRYDVVNGCKTLNELAEIILSFADKEGMIQGRTRGFNAESMAGFCRLFSFESHRTLTREFGIRQQALMILLYHKKGEKIAKLI